jgi:hypothetical protein
MGRFFIRVICQLEKKLIAPIKVLMYYNYLPEDNGQNRTTRIIICADWKNVLLIIKVKKPKKLHVDRFLFRKRSSDELVVTWLGHAPC